MGGIARPSTASTPQMVTKPTIADEIAAAFAGARFFRADLHIHSHGASHDVADAGFTPQAIVDKAASENLSAIAITDHNEISNVAAAVEAGEAKGVIVIPGVELSTPQGHILMYFQTVQNLESFYGKLDFADRGTNGHGKSPSRELAMMTPWENKAAHE